MTIEIQIIGWAAAALGTAMAVAFTTTPVVKLLAQRMGAVDVPKDNRRMHHHPIPRMGGLAIFLGFQSESSLRKIYSRSVTIGALFRD